MLTSLHHLIDREWMLEGYRLTRKDGGPGIDGMTATDYEANLEANLDDLLARIKSCHYIAPPVRRHYIPKADGTERPLGIPTLEDKVAQRAVLLLLEPIYEADFLPCSYGFRPGRSAHVALHALRSGFMEQGLPGWWTSISRNTSTPSTTRTCAVSSTSESRTASSGG
ncbi:reverse transcriptase domain-containing protein [Bradyrhizobium sp. CB1650]|uniref:reverse transcriptase domain-containing protein n=1 Tax=Bradyrhizobium sp. CB1650 TaxID=3039153 RepID=UPI0024358CD3|nr:reverse transcriptase domain-containing protein [Bradyrhizobium sp. CB1650]WGD56087.1 reverse transcriptase domain-containing protein [Bradyrhizobium sp. CB1650]